MVASRSPRRRDDLGGWRERQTIFALGLFDELNFVFGDDEHDFHTRAFHWFGWDSGFMALDWTQRKPHRSVVKGGPALRAFCGAHRAREAHAAAAPQAIRRRLQGAAQVRQLSASSPNHSLPLDACDCDAPHWWLEC